VGHTRPLLSFSFPSLPFLYPSPISSSSPLSFLLLFPFPLSPAWSLGSAVSSPSRVPGQSPDTFPENTAYDNRFSNPSCILAWYVLWIAHQLRQNPLLSGGHGTPFDPPGSTSGVNIMWGYWLFSIVKDIKGKKLNGLQRHVRSTIRTSHN